MIDQFMIIHGDMRDFIFEDEIELLLTSTPANEATSNKIVQEQLQQFLDEHKINEAVIDCEPITIEHPCVHVWDRGTYSKEDLCRRAISAYTDQGQIVIDPYCGGSYTGEIALKLGRRYIGIDIDLSSVERSRIRCQNILDGIPTIDERFIPT